jgi:DNA-binding ferritin-like protein
MVATALPYPARARGVASEPAKDRPMLTEGSRLAMTEAFAHLLGNTSSLQRATMSGEWNVRGPYSVEAAILLHRQAAELFRAQGLIAGRIRMMGGMALPDESDLVLTEREQGACSEMSDPEGLVRILASGHGKAIVSIRSASDVAIDIDDRGSLVVLDMRLIAHEQHLARLEAFCA